MSVHATRRRERAFEEFARQLLDALSDDIHEIVLYGSTARGDATETSDVDVLVVMKRRVSPTQRETISKLAFDVGLAYDVAISYHIQPKGRYQSRQDSPFLRNVLEDGRFYD